jgi:hypothetical protein
MTQRKSSDPNDNKSDHDLLIQLSVNVQNILTKLEGVVPDRCIAHAGEIASLNTQIVMIEKSLNSIYNRIWWAIGLALAAGLTAFINAVTSHLTSGVRGIGG